MFSGCKHATVAGGSLSCKREEEVCVLCSPGTGVGGGSRMRRRGAQSWGYGQKSERKSRKGFPVQAVREYGGAWQRGWQQG